MIRGRVEVDGPVFLMKYSKWNITPPRPWPRPCRPEGARWLGPVDTRLGPSPRPGGRSRVVGQRLPSDLAQVPAHGGPGAGGVAPGDGLGDPEVAPPRPGDPARDHERGLQARRQHPVEDLGRLLQKAVV